MIVTGSSKKIEEYGRYLGSEHANISVSKLDIDIPEIQSIDSQEIILSKVDAVSKVVSGPFLVDDVSFYTDRYPNFPGAYAKFTNNTLGVDGWSRLFEEGDKISAVATLGFYRFGKVDFFNGKIDGVISFDDKIPVDTVSPIDSTFYLPEYNNYLFNLVKSNDFKNHRRLAFEAFLFHVIDVASC